MKTNSGGISLTEAIVLLTAADFLSGITSWLTGGSSLSEFADQLVPFGEAMSKFSQAITGMDAEAVTGAANAGKALAELQRALPKTGGLTGMLFGEHDDMGAFGLQLVAFGASMKAYSLVVKGMDSDAVANSLTAGEALVELAKTLPNCGGVVSFFTGDNNISDFGYDLVLFGQDLALYSEAIKDVKPEVVTASVNAASALSSLAAGLPDSSLFNQWFGGDQTLASFGDDISSFGEDMGKFYSKISNVDAGKLSGIVAQIQSLADLAEGIQGLDKDAFSNFGESLRSLADSGISDFLNAFGDSGDSIDKAILVMLNAVSSSITSNGSVPVSAMKKLTTRVIDALNGTRDSFAQAGKNVVQGFVNGINAKLGSATSAGRQLGLAALNAARKALDSHSPSLEMVALGGEIHGHFQVCG